MKIEQIRIQNYKALRDVTVGPLPSMAVFVGANGSGKSTLFDVFSFLQDALLHNVRQALDKRGRYREVVSREETGPIHLEIKFRDKAEGPLVTYDLQIGLQGAQPVITRETLKYRRGQHGRPWHFLDFQNGEGTAITNEEDYDNPRPSPAGNDRL